MGGIKLYTYVRNLILIIISIAFQIFVLTFLFYPKIKEFQLPFKSYFQKTTLVQQSNNLMLDNEYSYNSTCSPMADRRGLHQRVIAYSLYGDFSKKDVFNKYILTLKSTISLIPFIYPDWVVRIYHNQTNGENLKLFTEHHVDLCNATEIIQRRNLGDLFAMTWRWLPLLDEMVDVLMSRDADSRIIPRETDAVYEWLASNKFFHVMRDHPAHCLFGPILGGCWGIKISQNRREIFHAAETMFTINHLHDYDYDQILLDELIWPIANVNVMVHDSYCCMIYSPSKPFPTIRRDRFFVASRALPNGKTEELSDSDECPQQCQPVVNMSSSFVKYC